MPSEWTPVSFADPRWSLTNSSQKPKVSSDGAELQLLTEPGTDWWRVPERDSSDGVLYSFTRPVGEGFEVSVELSIAHQAQVSPLTSPNAESADAQETMLMNSCETLGQQQQRGEAHE